ncbi:uncharacterized protein [Rutidosis leptorrhynchoides]|uniref:uncharacterized protein n=1 Tax=Rutidosis leptorrhynchoides TaxID=125765 RepID=UPI003A98EC20
MLRKWNTSSRILNVKSAARIDRASKVPMKSTCSSCAIKPQASHIPSTRNMQACSNTSSFSISNEGLKEFGGNLGLRGLGVGRDSKVGWLKTICRVQKPNFILLQETKLHKVDLHWIRVIWGNNNCNFIQKEMVGKSDGQLIIWDTDIFDATDTFSCDYFIGVRGIWKSSQKEMNVINVYGPHDDHCKAIFWDQLQNTISSDSNGAWMVCGDFNEVRGESERFNCIFVESRAKIKLDRFLVNESFHNLWNRLSVVALDRDKSDHCPIVLKDDDRNFGPKPIKIFDDWLEIDGMDHVIKKSWLEDVGGGSRLDCRLRKKLKKYQVCYQIKKSRQVR